MQVLLQVLEDVLESRDILRRDFTKSLVRVEHLLRLLLLLHCRLTGRSRRKIFALRRGRTVGMDGKDLVQAESGQQLAAAVAAMDNMEAAMTEFLQPQRHACESAHERGVHHHAILQVDHKVAVAAINHFAREVFEIPAVEEVPFACDADPNGLAVYPDLNG